MYNLLPVFCNVKLNKKSIDNVIAFSSTCLPHFYLAANLFGQVFLSSIANILHLENRVVMLALRFLIMSMSYLYIFWHFRREKAYYFLNPWVICLAIFWAIYSIRLSFDQYVSGVSLALPSWELFAWSLGSSLPIAICSFLFAAQNRLLSILFGQARYGFFLLGLSIVCFLVNPGLSQGAFYLEHLNAITCANAGCALFLLCFGKILVSKLIYRNFHPSKFIEWLGIAVGLFIVIYSATRGVLLAIFLIAFASIFFFWPSLKVLVTGKRKNFLLFFAAFSSVIFVVTRSPLLLDKLFTSRASDTILTRLEFWRISAEQFTANPLLGTGFVLQELLGSLEIEKGIYYPHNYLLESLAVGGIVMTFPLIYCMLFPLINFHKRAKSDPSVFPLWLLGVQALIYSMHNGHLGDFPFFWMIIGGIAGTKYRLGSIVGSEYASVKD